MVDFIKSQNNKLVIGILISLTVLLVGISLVNISSDRQEREQTKMETQVIASPVEAESYTYEGNEGVNALELLKSKYTVTQNDSELVTGINGRIAHDSAREYWSFYVNGEPSTIGPEQYITKEGDIIEWNIKTY